MARFHAEGNLNKDADNEAGCEAWTKYTELLTEAFSNSKIPALEVVVVDALETTRKVKVATCTRRLVDALVALDELPDYGVPVQLQKALVESWDGFSAELRAEAPEDVRSTIGASAETFLEGLVEMLAASICEREDAEPGEVLKHYAGLSRVTQEILQAHVKVARSRSKQKTLNGEKSCKWATSELARQALALRLPKCRSRFCLVRKFLTRLGPMPSSMVWVTLVAKCSKALC